MPKSLAELRAERGTQPDNRPMRAYTVCLAHDLIAEVQMLTEELGELPGAAVDAGDDTDRQGPPPRMGGGSPESRRAKEIQTRLAELLAEMAEYEGELRVRANRTDGEWRRWCNEHPARAEGEPGYDRDQQVAYGYCNADDLIDDMATYAHSWNSEPLSSDDWETLGVGNADKKQIASLVTLMYEADLSIPKWRSALSSSLRNVNGSTSRDDSESPNAGSSDGSPEKSTEAMTETATK